jgi:uncharacterized protein (TIGR01777 family)
MANPSRILISGASGLIGTSLIRAFDARRISVTRLIRDRQPQGPQEISWSPQSSSLVADAAQLDAFDAVIHLSGANLAAHRWTPAYKREIVESRVQTTQALAKLLAALDHPPPVFLCASATGIYGDRGDEILTESSAPGTGFLAETCMQWEDAAQPARAAGIRVVLMRFGVALTPAGGGGALSKLLPLFRLGLGGRLSSGEQWLSWISISDVVSAVFHLMQDARLAGPVNMVSPIPVTNAEFTRVLGKVLHRPAIFPAPAFALRAVVGEMAEEALLSSTRVIPARLAESGFHFEHARLDAALESLLAKPA